MVLIRCFDALLMNDGRELYVLENMLIKQYIDNSCVGLEVF
jgi:hypothetical protein